MFNPELRSLGMWGFGFIRILAVCLGTLSLYGVHFNFINHRLWDWSRFSGPTSVALLLVSVALFILGFRTEKVHAELSKKPRS